MQAYESKTAPADNQSHTHTHILSQKDGKENDK
jgi:hypothetical protein